MAEVLVTGATGYVGGRLVPRLLEAGHRVRVLTRDPERLDGRPWRDRVDARQGDALRPETLAPALEGVDAAYYLIHSMQGGDDFHRRDLRAAENVGAAAARAGVGQLIYLGGLGEPSAELSPHLRSRQETGEALRASGVPVTELRAAVVVGSGSVSFEMIRYLTERLPVMICPRWVFTRIQPIAIRDVLSYLVAALEVPACRGRVVEIGGADVLTYGDLMRGYAEARGLTRRLIPVPVLSPRLSSYWVHWMTPIPASIARPLIRGLRNEVVVRDPSARELFPEIQPMGYGRAVELALARLDAGRIETSWSDALVSSQGDVPPVQLRTEQGMILERRERRVEAPPEAAFAAFTSLGGDRGWLTADLLWRLRGVLDRMVGGVGFRRGRRDPLRLRPGDALDFWRVEAVEPGRLLRLRAEMKLPGKAWLEFKALPEDASGAEGSRLVQTAYFAPKGLLGLLYWYALYPFHGLIFGRLIDRLGEAAEAGAARAGASDRTPAEPGPEQGRS